MDFGQALRAIWNNIQQWSTLPPYDCGYCGTLVVGDRPGEWGELQSYRAYDICSDLSPLHDRCANLIKVQTPQQVTAGRMAHLKRLGKGES